MTYTILSVFNILVAAAMIVLIMMQRGAGADAGASFGGGSSGTVFGARGSATFLSRATGVLAAVFFIISLSMGMMLERQTRAEPQQDLGVMAGFGQEETPAAGASSTVPSVDPAAAGDSQAGSTQAVPQPAAAPVGAQAQGSADVPQAPTSASGDAAADSDVPAPEPAGSEPNQ